MMPHLYVAGARVPFQPTRFVRPANSIPHPKAGDRQEGSPSPAFLPVDLLTSSHDTPDSPKGQRDHGF